MQLIHPTATSALDAESETLVNSALTALLKGNNTTISIAHRLSTIKRSDRIIVLSSDGQVAEQGTFKELSDNPNGAFTKLMEWQMSGGETTDHENSTDTTSSSSDQLVDNEEALEKLGDGSESEGEVHDAEGDMIGKKMVNRPEVVSEKAIE